MSLFVTKVKGLNATQKYDINRVSESVLIPIFSEIYGYKNLKNLNQIKENYPAIDLGDDVAKVAFQITATSDSTKIKHTLEEFVKNELYKKYDRLIVYIITEKQNSYSGNGFQEILGGKFEFDKKQDIQDYRDILKRVDELQIDEARKIQAILEKNFGDNNHQYLFDPRSDIKTEEVFLNLVELNFPVNLYKANLSIDRGQYQNQKISWKDKDIIRAELERKGLKFSCDWTTHSGQLITFHNLFDPKIPLSNIIDKSSIEVIETPKFYSHSSDNDRVFKTLLGRCLQQQLFLKGIAWQNQEKIFIFSPSPIKDQEFRQITWQGEREGTRTVCERKMKSNKINEVLHYKHLAFSTEYKRFADQWYLLINPDWFFSCDGYRRSYYHENNVSWLKRNEKNRAVRNHFRFIVSYLEQETTSIFSNRKNFLSFGNVVSFQDSPYLNDQEWLPKKVEELEIPKSLNTDDDSSQKAEMTVKRRTKKRSSKKQEYTQQQHQQLSLELQ